MSEKSYQRVKSGIFFAALCGSLRVLCGKNHLNRKERKDLRKERQGFTRFSFFHSNTFRTPPLFT
jgi:hypothetical protein